MLSRNNILIGILIAAFLAVNATAPAQEKQEDISSRFTFARIKYGGEWLSRFDPFASGQGPPWSHDYPRGGRHLMKILTELTTLDANPDEVILTFDDPELFKYPFAYLCEVGYMQLSDVEIKGMREYLLRGGFLIVDDFRGEWALENFREHLRRAFPEFELQELDITHPIFNCFFNIETLDVMPPYGSGIPKFYGLSDQYGRLMMVVNYNNDISEYWEWSDDPFLPIEETNTAYKFGVNYALYALTH
jgi:hypothetical protein